MGGAGHEELAERFVRAAEARDAKELATIYAPDGRFWSTATGRVATTDDVLRIAEVEAEIIGEYRFDDVRIATTDDGFVLQMSVRGTTRSGTPFDAPVCIVATVRDRLIAAMDEYVDSGAVAPILAELA